MDEYFTVIGHGCSLAADDPQILIAWIRTLAHEITADAFLAITRALSNDPGNNANMQRLVENCIGKPV